VTAVNDTLSQWSDHIGRLAGIVGGGEPPVAHNWRTFWGQAGGGSDLIYFYCHGRFGRRAEHLPEQPMLELGPKVFITPDRLSAWAKETEWTGRCPLVVLNGCSTGETLPDLLASFVNAFVNSLSAAGVVATEIAVESRAAQYAAEVLIGLLWRGLHVGTAIRAMRWQLLRHGSVLGLAYSPYCDAFLSLPASNPNSTPARSR
jgi:hypothetical protein